MKLYLYQHRYHYEILNLVRMFHQGEKVEQLEESEDVFLADDGDRVFTGVYPQEKQTRVKAAAWIDGELRQGEDVLPNHVPDFDDECEYALARVLYRVLAALYGFSPKWGVLTGVRPVKLMLSVLARTGGEEEARQVFRDKYLLCDDKIDLCLRTAAMERQLTADSDEKSFSLYISIPFCPTRCSYCSFVSHSIEHAGHLVAPYLEMLVRELEETGKLVRELGLCLKSVYFGGGTPSILNPEQIALLGRAVADCFDLSTLHEYTFEAGRPDTITAEKLDAILSMGARRISINPQSFQDAVLRSIGRQHTAAQCLEAYGLASHRGFDTINMDLIAGLEGDTPETFRASLKQAVALGAANITVHTLAAKRAAANVTEGRQKYNPKGDIVNEMVEDSIRVLTENGYRPYYLYRQKNMCGNLENIGWSRPGHEGYYNVYTMNEIHTILAAGAGGVTKLVNRSSGLIRRVANFKYPYEYLSGFEQMIERKQQVRAFYDKV